MPSRPAPIVQRARNLFSFLSLLAALAPNFPTLLFFRGLHGPANAPTLPAVMAIIARVFPQEERMQALGIWAFVNSALHAIGPPLSGFLVQSCAFCEAITVGQRADIAQEDLKAMEASGTVLTLIK
jgi:MFS family permease